MRARLAFVTGLAALTLSGCSSYLSSREITGVEVGKRVDGLPYRERDNLEIKVYELTPGGYKQVAQKVQTMADPSRLKLLEMQGQPFSNPTLAITMAEDSTLSMVDLKSNNQFDESLASLGGGFKEAATANAELRKARKDDDIADATAIEAAIQGDYTDDLAALELANQLQLARDELLELPPGAVQSVRRAKELQIATLEFKLQNALRKAAD